MPSKPLAVLPVFPSAVTAVAFSSAPPNASSPGGGGCNGGSARGAHGTSAEYPADASAQPGPVQCMLAVGLESGALEVWAVAVAGGHHDTPRIAGAAPPQKLWSSGSGMGIAVLHVSGIAFLSGAHSWLDARVSLLQLEPV